MICCPIIKKEIEEKECDTIIRHIKTSEDEELVLRRIKRINGWKFICRNCKNHNK